MATATIAGPALSTGTTLRNVDWETYCKLRDEPANDQVRMTYLDGDLTIMAPEIRHDWNSRRLLYVVTVVARACRIEFEPIGTTTLRREGRAPRQGAGKEPDEGFYLGEDAVRIKDNDDLNLAVDPPPSLAIEVDNKADSEQALPTYARIRVPEVWRYDVRHHTLWFGRLAGEGYDDIDRSPGLPRLTPSLVLQALEARTGGMSTLAWLDWLDRWARGLPDPPAA